MRRVFVDTGGFVALRNAAEREHPAARAVLAELVGAGASLFTSNYVVAETYTALLMRVSQEEAITWGRRVRAGQSVEVVRIDETVEDAAWELLERHTDKRWSYVDATSFALMEEQGTDEAFAFDHHFAQRGLRLHPAPGG